MAVDVSEVLKEVDKFMDDFADSVHLKAQRNLIDDGKIDTANITKTSHVIRESFNKSVVFPASYADDIEFGRIPGSMPPVDALVPWVRRKLGVSNEKEARRVAFAIALSIKKRGIDAFPYLRMAVDATSIEFGVEQ